MKGIGNYSQLAQQVERQTGTLVASQGPRSTITLMGGMTYSVPTEPFRKADVKPGERFVMLTTRVNGRVVSCVVSKPPAARPPLDRRQTPKVYVREGERVVTRR